MTRQSVSRRLQFLHVVAASTVIGICGLIATEDALADRTITCESHSNNKSFCRTDTGGGVTLQTQLSSSGCYQGTSWGYDSRGIWVANGCRGIFRVGDANYQHHGNDDDSKAGAALAGLAVLALGAAAVHEAHKDHERDRHDDDYYEYRPNDYDMHYYQNRGVRHYQTTCESINDRYNYCRAPVHNSHVRLLRRHSDSGCEFHRDWGYDSRGIWVENGCRATFEIE